ncbi:UNVERIFIED_CONTAM: CRISPR-associated protein (TIGR03984 family) [Acetivibrio alkalicellulosi]
MSEIKLSYNNFDKTNEAILPLGITEEENIGQEIVKYFKEDAYYIAYCYDELKVGRLSQINGRLEEIKISFDNLSELRVFNYMMEYRAIRINDDQFSCRLAGKIENEAKEIIPIDYEYCELHSVFGTDVNEVEKGFCMLSERERGIFIKLPIDSLFINEKQYEPNQNKLLNLFIKTKNYITSNKNESNEAWSYSIECVDSRIEGFYRDCADGLEAIL